MLTTGKTSRDLSSLNKKLLSVSTGMSIERSSNTQMAVPKAICVCFATDGKNSNITRITSRPSNATKETVEESTYVLFSIMEKCSEEINQRRRKK